MQYELKKEKARLNLEEDDRICRVIIREEVEVKEYKVEIEAKKERIGDILLKTVLAGRGA